MVGKSFFTGGMVPPYRFVFCGEESNMALFRIILRILKLIAVVIWMCLIGLYTFIGLLFIKDNWDKRYFSSKCARIWGMGLRWIIGLDIKINGDSKQLEQGGLIVSNHTGYCDIVAHASIFPVRFAPKQQIRSWPFLGTYLSLSQPIWINRNSTQQAKQVAEQFKETLEHGINLIVYPEGTSTDGQSGLLPFKSTAFEAVSGTGLPILPLITVYHDTKDGNTLPWHSNQKLLPHIWRLLGYTSISAELHILPAIYTDKRMNRKQLAALTREKMIQKYQDITGNEPEAPIEKYKIPKE